MTRAAHLNYSVNLARSITGAGLTPMQGESFAIYGILLLGHLAVRCEGCARKRMTAGIDKTIEGTAWV